MVRQGYDLQRGDHPRPSHLTKTWQTKGQDKREARRILRLITRVKQCGRQYSEAESGLDGYFAGSISVTTTFFSARRLSATVVTSDLLRPSLATLRALIAFLCFFGEATFYSSPFKRDLPGRQPPAPMDPKKTG